MKKRNLLIISLAVYGLFLTYWFEASTGLCETLNIFVCKIPMDSISGPAGFFGLTALITIFIYKAPNRVYKKWRRFLLISIPLITAASIIIDSGYLHSNAGLFNLDASFDRLYFYCLYLLFSLGAIVQIIRGYYQKIE